MSKDHPDKPLKPPVQESFGQPFNIEESTESLPIDEEKEASDEYVKRWIPIPHLRELLLPPQATLSVQDRDTLEQMADDPEPFTEVSARATLEQMYSGIQDAPTTKPVPDLPSVLRASYARVSTIFLDRDGVINEIRSDFVKSWEEFRFLPGSREAIAALTKAGHRIVVCTNQLGVAQGLISLETMVDIHRRMMAAVEEVGGVIEKVYVCSHSKTADCDCRKPRPGMLLRASRELGLDMSEAVLVGDSITDMQAGQAAGVHTILVLTGLGMEHFRQHYQQVNRPFRVALNLQHAADIILQGLHIYTSMEKRLHNQTLLDMQTLLEQTLHS